MEMMKRTLMAAALLLTVCSGLDAQETKYFLPSTTLTLDVEARQEYFYAGPYAAYAAKMLNLDVRTRDQVSTQVTRVTLRASVEADPTAVRTLEGNAPTELLALSAQGLVAFQAREEAAQAEWRFGPVPESKDFNGKGLTGSRKEIVQIQYKTVQTDTSVIRIPVEHRQMVNKTMEDKAADAAEMILNARRERMNIATGNTDANFSGAALQSALAELDRVEKEYLLLFTGYSVYCTQEASFDVVPNPGNPGQRYTAFVVNQEKGLLDASGVGTPYYVLLEKEKAQVAVSEPAQEQPEAKRNKTVVLHYRVPAICKLSVTEDGQPRIQARVPVYQMGAEQTMTVNKQ